MVRSLNREIKELVGLVHNRADRQDIMHKADDIRVHCQRLLNEHEEGSKVALLLKEIDRHAEVIILSGQGKNVRGIDDFRELGRFPAVALERALGMNHALREIGEILKLFFDETEG